MTPRRSKNLPTPPTPHGELASTSTYYEAPLDSPSFDSSTLESPKALDFPIFKSTFMQPTALSPRSRQQQTTEALVTSTDSPLSSPTTVSDSMLDSTESAVFDPEGDVMTADLLEELDSIEMILGSIAPGQL